MKKGIAFCGIVLNRIVLRKESKSMELSKLRLA